MTIFVQQTHANRFSMTTINPMIAETDKKDFDFEHYRIIRNRSLGRLFWRIKRYMDSRIEPSLHEQGFTDFKMSYLMFLSNIEETGTTNNELARRAGVTKQMMSKTVSLLEEEGYIYTQKNPLDSRSSVIFLNERGKDLFLAIQESMQKVRSRFDTMVGHDCMEQAIDTLYKITVALDQEEQ